MTRVCLVGMGTPALNSGCDHSGPGLRCAHFARALEEQGHEVLILAVGNKNAVDRCRGFSAVRVPGHAGIQTLEVTERDFSDRALTAVVEGHRPEALVGATAYASSLALRLGLDLPCWADVFGDLMAEAQAKASMHGDDSCLVHFWSVLAPVLANADRFSAVSQAQSYALVGQLGLAGRLSAYTAGEELVTVIPCAAEEQEGRDEARAGDEHPAKRLAALPQSAFVVLWSGSFNTWCDVETLFEGVEEAMGRIPRLYFVCCGGPVPGHDDQSWPKFRRMVEASEWGDRFVTLGLVDSRDLPWLYRRADVGINIEKELCERTLGSENRVVHWMAHGLAAVTTARSELGRFLVQRGMAFACEPRNAASLADLLSRLAADAEVCAAAGRACRVYAASHFGFQDTAAPLLRWCERPQRAGDSGVERTLSVGLFSEPDSAVHLLEAYLSGLSLSQLARRVPRWLWRRLSSPWRRIGRLRSGDSP